MTAGLFITGTDTGCGKTYVCCEILNYFGTQGLDVVGLKPIASGANMKNGCLHNEDVTLLYKNSNIIVAEREICRYMFPEPCSYSYEMQMWRLPSSSQRLVSEVREVEE